MVEKSADEERRDSLTLQLEGAPANGRTEVGLAYLQLGLRWIPSYRVTLDETGKARVELQATLINELVDLAGADVHLAIGVPSFKFADDVDPISLRSTVARLAGGRASPGPGGGPRSTVWVALVGRSPWPPAPPPNSTTSGTTSGGSSHFGHMNSAPGSRWLDRDRKAGR